MLSKWESPLFSPGTCHKYLPYEGVDGETCYLIVPDEWPYEGYREELERREAEEGICLDTVLDEVRPGRIVLKKWAAPIDFGDLAGLEGGTTLKIPHRLPIHRGGSFNGRASSTALRE